MATSTRRASSPAASEAFSRSRRARARRERRELKTTGPCHERTDGDHGASPSVFRPRQAAGNLAGTTAQNEVPRMTIAFPSAGPVTLRTNLADYPITRALKTGDVRSDLVGFDFAGPKVAHEGFKPMVREAAFAAGELAIVTYLQARIYGKPLVLLPAVVMGRFQHQCIGCNVKAGALAPETIEG